MARKKGGAWKRGKRARRRRKGVKHGPNDTDNERAALRDLRAGNETRRTGAGESGGEFDGLRRSLH